MPKLLYEKRDRVAWLTLNRPEAKNAIDPELHKLLWEAWEDYAADDSLDVAILTGSGDAFCAGADLKTYIPPLFDPPRTPDSRSARSAATARASTSAPRRAHGEAPRRTRSSR